MGRAEQSGTAQGTRNLDLMIACARRISGRIECVVDELRRRGHEVELRIEDEAALALQSASVAHRVRVLCVDEPLTQAELDRLDLALDPEGHDNLLVLTLDRTAEKMANRIEVFAVQATGRARKTRVTRAIQLPVPQERANPRRWLTPALVGGAAGVALLAVAASGLGRVEKKADPVPQPVPRAAVATPEPPRTAAPNPETTELDDTPFRVSVRTDDPSDEEIVIFDILPKKAAPKTAPEPKPAEDAAAKPAVPPPVISELGDGSSSAVTVLGQNANEIHMGTALFLAPASEAPAPADDVTPQ